MRKFGSLSSLDKAGDGPVAPVSWGAFPQALSIAHFQGPCFLKSSPHVNNCYMENQNKANTMKISVGTYFVL